MRHEIYIAKLNANSCEFSSQMCVKSAIRRNFEVLTQLILKAPFRNIRYLPKFKFITLIH